MNKYGTLTAEQNTFYQRTLLKELTDSVVLLPYAKKASVPKNEGQTTSWRIFKQPALTKTPLTEGVTPSDVDITIDKIQAAVSQYGTYTKISDQLQDTGIDPVVTEVTEMFGGHAGLTLDSIAMDVVGAGTNVAYGGGKTSRGSVTKDDKFTYSMLTSITEFFKRQNVKKIKMPNGRMGYVALTPPEVMTTIKNWTEWKDANKYTDAKMIKRGIIGELDGVYFQDANTAPIYKGEGASSIDVFGVIFLGDEAFGTPDIAGKKKPQIIVKDKGTGGTENPMELYSTIAWKSLFVAKRLREEAIYRIEVAGR
ncbi:MAG: N4-gp56 family major capsid protein [Vallitalea sp.]|jgi:N4-gp56 family major capsid protein|nr:N4-gp56 family major capsid protein [Vallitalea sp.]